MTTTAKPAAGRTSHEVPSDHVWHPERVVLSPDGVHAAFVIEDTRSGDADQSGVWFGALTQPATRLTDEKPATNLVFTADGAALAYAVNSDATCHVVVRDLTGGEVHRHPLVGVAELVRLAPDGALLVLLAEPGADTASLSSGKPMFTDAPLVRSNRSLVGWRRVWRVDPRTGATVAITPDELTVWQFAPLPDGRMVAIAGADPGEAGWYHSVLTLLGPEPAQRADLYTPTWQLGNIAVSPDARHVAVTEGWTSDRGLDTGDIRVVDLESGAAIEMADIGVDVTSLTWTADDRLCFAGWRGLGTAWGWVDSPTSPEPTVRVHAEVASCLNSRWHPEVVPLPDRTVLTVRSTETQPPEVTRLAEDAEPVAWTDVNAAVPRDRGFDVSEVHWDADGVQLDGLLVVPSGRSGPQPLVVDIHGGPSLCYHHSWDLSWAETITGAGYAFFLPNPYGGTGRGQDFARKNLNDPAGAEFEQVLKGVRHLIDAGVADPRRTAAMGASYGGYLTAWAVARGDVFAGGIVISGMSDLISCWGTANNGPFYVELLGGAPPESGARYLDRSPVSVIGKQSLPALILHGELDQCVPVTQARELFATLTHAGVPADLVVYPDEGHQTDQIEHVRNQRERIVTFLDGLFQ